MSALTAGTTDQGTDNTNDTSEGGTPAASEGTAPAGSALSGDVGGGETVEGDKGKPAQSTDAEIHVTLPEGISFDEKVINEFKGIAKEAGLNSESASKVASWYAQKQAKQMESEGSAWKDQGETWAKELKAHPEMGGDKLENTVMMAQSALRKFGGKEVAADIDAMGLGNHPGLVHMLARIGEAISEDDSGAQGSGASAGTQTQEGRLSQLYNKSGN